MTYTISGWTQSEKTLKQKVFVAELKQKRFECTNLIHISLLGRYKPSCLLNEEVKHERKSTGIENKYNFLSIVLKINHEEGQIQNSLQKHIFMILSCWCVTKFISMMQVGVACMGNEKRDKHIGASISCLVAVSPTAKFTFIFHSMKQIAYQSP